MIKFLGEMLRFKSDAISATFFYISIAEKKPSELVNRLRRHPINTLIF